MKRHLLLSLLACMALSSQAVTVTDTIFHRYEHEDYAFGADVSFVPMMEGWGTKWLDKNGQQKDILQILKEQGINNIRLRVWTVNNGASSKQEVVNMCKRAKQAGMGVMIDFHYSDTWADPGNQTIPAAWTDHSVEALAKNVYNHTYDVLSAIKAAGVVPRWVQVGNETKRGMLYPVGQTNKGGSVAFAKFVLNGYNAVKAVDSTMQVIVHLPDGHDNSLYRSIFDGLKKNGAKWDIIGLSAYPRWSHLDGPTMITRVMNNINDLKSRYGKPCMVVETGHYPREAVVGNQYLVGLMDRMIKNGDLGCFYWEPESMGGYDMGAWDEATRRPTVMMDAFLGVKHTEVPWVMKTQMQWPAQEQTVEPTPDMELTAQVQHARKGRVKSLEFFLDKKKVGTYTVADLATAGTIVKASVNAGDVAIGPHTAWATATDNVKNSQTSDTVTFFVGEWALMGEAQIVNGGQKGGTAQWSMTLAAPGKYRLAFNYSCESLRGAELSLNGVSQSRPYFMKNTDGYYTTDVEVTAAGSCELLLTSTSLTGFPAFHSLRVFPLDGQPLPVAGGQARISTGEAEATEVEVYSLSGMLLFRSTEAQLGVDLGGRSCAVLTLPRSAWNCVGDTPYIVRKQRLK